MDPPIVIPTGKKVTRWHPKFRLDEVPDIPAVPLPPPPESTKMCNTTAKDVIAKAQDLLQAANPRMKKALEDLMKKAAPVEGQAPAQGPSSAPPTTESASAGERQAATKAAIAKAQLALLKRAKANPKMTKALHDILTKNKKAEEPSSGGGESEWSGKGVARVAGPASSSASAPAEQPKAGPSKNSLGPLKGISQSLLDKVRPFPMRERELDKEEWDWLLRELRVI
jgi:primosomal protein N'